MTYRNFMQKLQLIQNYKLSPDLSLKVGLRSETRYRKLYAHIGVIAMN